MFIGFKKHNGPVPQPPILNEQEINAIVAQYHAAGIFGWPLLGGGYLSAEEWRTRELARSTAAA